MNTATHDLWTGLNQTGNNYGLSRIGAGRIDIANALNSNVVAFDTAHPERVSVSLGLVEVVNTATINHSITVENKGAASETYDLSFEDFNLTPGVSYTVSPSSVTVAANSSTTITVTLHADVSAMANVNTPDPTTPLTQPGAYGNLPRERIMEAGGYVVLSPTTSTAELRVPVWASARPASNMRAAGPLEIGQGNTGTTLLPLTGTNVFTGASFPNDIVSQVTAMELVATDPVTEPSLLGSADIKYIGISSDYLAQLQTCSGDTTCAINNTTVYIGIATYGNWSTMSGLEADFDIGIDGNNDGVYDTHVFNFETGYLASPTSLGWTDSDLAWYTNGASWYNGPGTVLGATAFLNGYPPGFLETYVYDTNVIVLPVSASVMGLAPGNGQFRFNVQAFSSFYYGDLLPASGWYNYDIANPAYSFDDASGDFGGPYAGIPMWGDYNGGSIPVDYNVTGLSPLPSILLLHHHNAASATVGRAEVVTVQRSTQVDAAVTKTVDNDAPAENATVTFTVDLDNNGPGVLDDPVMTDTLPAGLTYVSDTCPGTSSTAPSGADLNITCDMTGQSLPQSFYTEYTITATVDSGTSGQILTNTATLTSMNAALTDIDLSNNSAEASVCVDGISGQCGVADHLAFTQQPSDTVVSTTITPSVTVEVLDSGNHVVPSATDAITLAIGTDPSSGSATLSGTTTVSAVAGVATFSDLSIDKVGYGYTLNATASGLTGDTSSAFNITSASPLIHIDYVNPNLVVTDAGNHVTEGESIGDRFAFSLTQHPTSDVTVTFTSTDPTQLQIIDFTVRGRYQPVASYTVTFSASGSTGPHMVAWNTPVVINLYGMPDTLTEGIQTYGIHFDLTSANSAYNNLPVTNEPVDVYDPGVTLNPTSLSVAGGTSTSYTVVLNGPPGFMALTTALGGNRSERVTVTLSPDSNVTITSPMTLTFDRSNWNVPQTVNLTTAAGTGYLTANVQNVVSSDISLNPYMDSPYGGPNAPAPNIAGPTIIITNTSASGASVPSHAPVVSDTINGQSPNVVAPSSGSGSSNAPAVSSTELPPSIEMPGG